MVGKDQGNGRGVPQRMGKLKSKGDRRAMKCAVFLPDGTLIKTLSALQDFAACMDYRDEGMEDALPRMCCMDRMKDFNGKVENSASDPYEFKELTKNSWQREELARLDAID